MASQPTRSADVNIKFYDGTSGELIYYYNRKISGLNVRYATLAGEVTKKAIKKSPYTIWRSY